jgi:hypothetical protein
LTAIALSAPPGISLGTCFGVHHINIQSCHAFTS